MSKVKENITQVILIIFSILIAFGIDRAYEAHDVNKRKELFIKDQIKQISDENNILKETINSGITLKETTKKGLNFIQDVDSLIENTQWLGKLSYFDAEIKELKELNEIYNVNEFIDFELKKEFQKLYWKYNNIEFYENDYYLEIYKSYKPFWRTNYNSHNNSYPDKNKFLSDEYLNIVKNCIDILERRIEAYVSARIAQEQLIEKLKKEASR